MRGGAWIAALAALGAACGSQRSPTPAPAAAPPQASAPVRVAAETVTVRDAEAARRAARLELEVWERDAQIAELGNRLDEARNEVVRAMAKLQTLATRAEAAAGLAEADVALQALRPGAQQISELRKATDLLQQSTAEFDKQNYGGALYLANEAKTVAAQGRRRLAGGGRGSLRPGEVLFVLPVELRAVTRGNVREGPGTNFGLVFTAESGAGLTGLSYLADWVRVSDESGRVGWIARSLIDRRP